MIFSKGLSKKLIIKKNKSNSNSTSSLSSTKKNLSHKEIVDEHIKKIQLKNKDLLKQKEEEILNKDNEINNAYDFDNFIKEKIENELNINEIKSKQIYENSKPKYINNILKNCAIRKAQHEFNKNKLEKNKDNSENVQRYITDNYKEFLILEQELDKKNKVYSDIEENNLDMNEFYSNILLNSTLSENKTDNKINNVKDNIIKDCNTEDSKDIIDKIEKLKKINTNINSKISTILQIKKENFTDSTLNNIKVNEIDEKKSKTNEYMLRYMQRKRKKEDI